MKLRKRGLGSRGAHSQVSAWNNLGVNPCLRNADGSKPEEKNYQEGYSKCSKELIISGLPGQVIHGVCLKTLLARLSENQTHVACAFPDSHLVMV